MATVLLAQASVLAQPSPSLATVVIAQVAVEADLPPVNPRFIKIAQIEVIGEPPPDDPALVRIASVSLVARQVPQPSSDIKVRWANHWVIPRNFMRLGDQWIAFDTTSYTPPPPVESSGFGSAPFGSTPFGS